jgi:uncharacterized membrane protein
MRTEPETRPRRAAGGSAGAPGAAAHMSADGGVDASGRSAGAATGARAWLTPERAGLAMLYAFTVVAVVGYAVFGRDPSRLVGLPTWAVAFYAQSFGFFAQGHVWLAMGVLAVVLWRAAARWLAAFGIMYAISLGSELAGTTWGVPFGAYSYSSAAGPMWLDRVPVVIPLSWFFMALPSYALASAAGVAWRGLVGR